MSTGKALLLHDDPRTVALVRAIVSDEGFGVAAAETPFRLLEVAPEAVPDLVLLGLTCLEDRDLELVGVLRRRWPVATMLVLFPSVLRERAARCLELGADGYLPEPFYAGELAAMARAAAARKGAASEPRAAWPAAEAATAPPAGARPGDESLTKLAAGIAHSVRNPLQILELQLGTYETDGRIDVPGMREQLARVAAVAEALTRYSGRRKLNTRLIDVNSLVQRVFGNGRPRGLPVQLRLANERLEVLGAPDLLRAAVDAIRDRAERVTPEGADLEVTTGLVEERGERFAEVVVTDGGPLPTAEQIDAFFDPFPDADRVVDGSGMEMAAAAGIVRNHGGRAFVRGGAGAGTAVVLRLPARGRGGTRASGEAP